MAVSKTFASQLSRFDIRAQNCRSNDPAAPRPRKFSPAGLLLHLGGPRALAGDKQLFRQIQDLDVALEQLPNILADHVAKQLLDHAPPAAQRLTEAELLKFIDISIVSRRKEGCLHY